MLRRRVGRHPTRMVTTLYALKPRFQELLRPAVARLARAGVTANEVTVLAMALSVATGAFVAFQAAEVAGGWPFAPAEGASRSSAATAPSK